MLKLVYSICLRINKIVNEFDWVGNYNKRGFRMNTYEKIQELKVLQKDISDSKETIELVINSSYGGFSFSKEGCDYLDLKYENGFGYPDIYEYNRSNPKLVQCIKDLGDKAGYSLKIIKIDINDIKSLYLNEYDGNESVDYSCKEYSTPLIQVL